MERHKPQAGDRPGQDKTLGSSGGQKAPASPLSARRDGRDGRKGPLVRFILGLVHRGRGLAAMGQGRFDSAERELRQAMAALGRRADPTPHGGRLCGEGAKVVAARGEGAGAEGDGPTAWRQKARGQWRQGRRVEAQMTLHEALRRFGGVAELHLQLGLFHAAEQRIPAARSSLARAAEADCTNPDAHYYLGLAAAAEGDARAAVRSLQRAFLLRPDDLLLTYQLCLAAKAAADTGMEVELRMPGSLPTLPGPEIEQLADYVAAEPDFVDAFLALPESQDDEALFEMLEKVVRSGLSRRGARADLLLRQSQLLHRLGRIHEALRQVRRAIRVNRRYVQALVHLARLYARLDRPVQAARAAREAIAAGADWPDVHCLAAEVLHRCHRTDRAVEHLKRALQLNPNYQRAAEALTKLAA